MKVYEISWHKYLLPPIHPEGWRILAVVAAISALLGVLFEPLGWVGAVITVWCFYFFRDPVRITPVGESLVVSPADGVVQMVGLAPPPPELEMGDKPLTRISVFMSVFNVHVNRVPIAGKIVKTHYHKGTFVNASLDKASENNERQSVRLKIKGEDREIAFVQIAGLVARRILCGLNEKQEVNGGERFGLIRFGSRLDVYLPEGVEPLVIPGQTAVAGETILADVSGEQKTRSGEIR
ncbi:MAG: phosphatidylserine decarboxylase [Alphaproteobacteria bacterium]|nr:phosphatidylserine decarboxylase [Alphaproteobacteria bacterium]